MKKIFYFSYINQFNIGVKKKIQFQKEALKRNNFNLIDEEIEQNVSKVKLQSNLNLIKKIFYKIKQKRGWEKICLNIFEICSKKKVEIIYIRYPGSTKSFIKLLRNLKKNHIKIYIEIPTYPYDQELKKNIIFKITDKYYRRNLIKYVEKIITYSEDEKIWNIPCINISNGIDLEEIKIIERKNKEIEEIVFTSVSNCSFWHGIDRFLYSLEKYKNLKEKINIIFNIVGEGAELKTLRNIVDESDYLLKIVKFKGFQKGGDLDIIYNETDICVGCLGNHRKNIYTIQALKNKEYMAKGLPMIFSEDDPGLRNLDFVYKASHDEELINIEDIIKWYRNLKITSQEIREYANPFSWDVQMKKVIDNL